VVLRCLLGVLVRELQDQLLQFQLQRQLQRQRPLQSLLQLQVLQLAVYHLSQSCIVCPSVR
jgi:hypothetical protein